MNKAVQDTDIPNKILKEKAEYFSKYFCLHNNKAISASKFPASFKFAKVTTAFKQGSRNLNDNYRPISILPIILKYFKSLIVDNFQITLIIFFRNFNVVLQKGAVRNIVEE